MKVIFSENFKKDLKDLGNNIKLSIFRVGAFDITQTEYDKEEHNILSEYYSFKSIWSDHNNTLDITIDLSDTDLGNNITIDPLRSEQANKRNSIFVYYSDINDNLIGKAFVMVGDLVNNIPDNLNLCFKNKENRRDLNHFSVQFPKDCVANIYTVNDVSALESSYSVVGSNLLLYGLDDDTKDYVTKNSYQRSMRNEISKLNDTPNYLTEKGEIISNRTTYKHYVKISIKPSNIVGNYPNYHISNGFNVKLDGYCIYNLLELVNGNYLLKEVCKEDLSNVIIKEANGNINSPDYSIDQLNKIIDFNYLGESKTTNFIGEITFKSKKDNKLVTIKSNELRFTNYINWNIKYSTNLFQKDNLGIDHPIFLFDTTKYNNGWNPKEEYSNNIITIYSDIKLGDTKNSIIISSEDIDSFNRFFKYSIETRPFDKELNKYPYVIKFSTLSDNTSNRCEPLIDGQPILNTLSVYDSNKLVTSTKFYCIQRCIPKLELRSYDLQGWNDPITSLSFKSKFGIDSIKGDFYVFSSSNEYRWEIINNNPNIITDYNKERNYINTLMSPPIVGSNVKFYGRSSRISKIDPNDSSEIDLGTITFREINKISNGYDPNYWKDIIYCHPDNNVEIKFTIKPNLNSNIAINSHNSENNYYYTDNNNQSYRLLVFDRHNELEFRNTLWFSFTNNSGLPSVEQQRFTTEFLSSQEEELFYKHFNLNLHFGRESLDNTTSGSISINIKNNIEEDSSNWEPKSSNNCPVSFLIKLDKEVVERVFCVIRPSLSNTISILNDTNLSYLKDIYIPNDLKYTNFIVGSSVSSSDYSYWIAKNLDNELILNHIFRNTKYQGGSKIVPLNSIESNKIISEISTKTVPSTTLDINFDELVIQRVVRKYDKDTSGLDYLRDWENQLTEVFSKHVKVSLEGQDPSNTVRIFCLDEENNKKELLDEEELNLDYIGIYKLFIKSDSKFRISLENSEKENIYFFNRFNSDIDSITKSVEEDIFDNNTGIELSLVFLGGEEGCFNTSDKHFNTVLRAINLKDGTSKIIRFKRNYDKLDTNITFNKKKLILPNNIKFANIKYKSNLETNVELSNRNISINNYIKDFPERFDYNYYEYPATVVRDGIIRNFKSRGYLYNSLNILIDDTYLPRNYHYPVPLVGNINITTPKEDGESLSIGVYRLAPFVPESVISTDLLELPTNINSYKYFTINLPSDGKVDIYLSDDPVVPNYVKLIDSEITSKNGYLKLTREDDISGTSTKIIVTNLGRPEGEDLETSASIGGVKVVTYVDSDNFILDQTGNPIKNLYTQEEVNEIILPSEKVISINRLSSSESRNLLSPVGGFSVSEKGELKKFTVSKKIESDPIDVNFYKSEFSKYVKNIYLESKTVTAEYINRLERYNYSPIKFKLTKEGYLDLGTLKKFKPFTQSEMPSNISIKVGNEKVSSVLVKQLPWINGIRIDDTVYMGNNNKVTYKLDWLDAVFSINSACVSLPISCNSPSEDVFSNISVSENDVEIINLLESSPYQLQKERQSYISGIPGMGGFDLFFSITNPNNSQEDLLISKFKITDSSKQNSVEVEVILSKKIKFDSFLSTEITLISGNLYKLDNMISEIPISASGRLKYPNLYLITETPRDLCKISLLDIEIIENKHSDLKYRFENSIESSYIGQTEIRGKSNKYNIFKLLLKSKLKSIELKSSSVPYSELPGHIPYKGLIPIVINENNTLKATALYGCANLELIGPSITDLSVNNELSETNYISDFENIDNIEENKYLRSKLITNNNFSAGIYYMDDSISIYYSEDKNNPKYFVNSKKSGNNLWDTMGYYCGFKLKATRFEWVLENKRWIAKESDNFAFQNNNDLKLVIDEPQEITIYKDHLYERGENGNPEQYTVKKYYSIFEDFEDKQTDSSIKLDGGVRKIYCTSLFNFPFTSILLNYKKESFTKRGNTYNLSTTLVVRGNVKQDGILGKYYDPITFKINISIIPPSQ